MSFALHFNTQFFKRRPNRVLGEKKAKVSPSFFGWMPPFPLCCHPSAQSCQRAAARQKVPRCTKVAKKRPERRQEAINSNPQLSDCAGGSSER